MPIKTRTSKSQTRVAKHLVLLPKKQVWTPIYQKALELWSEWYRLDYKKNFFELYEKPAFESWMEEVFGEKLKILDRLHERILEREKWLHSVEHEALWSHSELPQAHRTLLKNIRRSRKIPSSSEDHDADAHTNLMIWNDDLENEPESGYVNEDFEFQDSPELKEMHEQETARIQQEYQIIFRRLMKLLAPTTLEKCKNRPKWIETMWNETIRSKSDGDYFQLKILNILLEANLKIEPFFTYSDTVFIVESFAARTEILKRTVQNLKKELSWKFIKKDRRLFEITIRARLDNQKKSLENKIKWHQTILENWSARQYPNSLNQNLNENL